MTVPTAQVRLLVEEWLPGQRWFAGKGRPAEISADPMATLTVGPPDVAIWTASVDYADGGHEIYQLPLALRTEPIDSLEHVLLGTIGDGADRRWVYDALHDRDVTQVWLEGIRDQRADGELSFSRLAEPDAVPVGETSLVLSAEQSNTSLIFGDTAILKVFRRLEPGINPDIEVHEALARRGSKNVAALLGSLTADLEGEPVSLAMLQEFLRTGTDGWQLAKTSVRDLMAESDLHAGEVGGDFAAEARRLGATVAEVHSDLADAFGVETADADSLRLRGAAMQARLDTALTIVPQLAEHETELRALFDLFTAELEPVTIQRVHGDLHLGQAMRTVRRWVVLDFEGEPVSTMSSRRQFDSPLRDVAGMLRSFDYASRHQLVDIGFTAQLSYRADEWADRNRDAFCDGYAESAGSDPRDQDARLRAFEADKAVYEAVYEARNRPTWLGIPLASLTRLRKHLAEEGTLS